MIVTVMFMMLFADYGGSIKAKKKLLVKHRATSGTSASNHVEKEIKSSRALMGSGPQTATGTLHWSSCTLTNLSKGMCCRECICLCVY